MSLLHLTLCNPMDCHWPSSSAHGISEARIQEWIAVSYSMGSSRPRNQTRISCVSCIGRQIFFFLITAPPRKPFVYMPISNPSLCISMVICLYLYLYFGKGNDNPLQYSCLENSMDRGAWRATVHGVARVRHDLRD